MKGSKLTAIIIVIVLILIGAIWAYNFFGAETSEPIGVTVTSGNGNETQNATSTADPFVSMLDSVETITLDDRKLLENPIFKEKLSDFSPQIGDRGVGRDNPFAPIGSGNITESRSATINLTEKKATTTSATSSQTDLNQGETE